MANTTSFTFEGPMTLAYYANEWHSKRVLINTKEEGMEDGDVLMTEENFENLESKIVNEIGFPNYAEFNEVFRKLDQLRERGLRTKEGVPDRTREVQLRITVEVL